MAPASLILASLLMAPGAELKIGPSDWPQWRGPNRDGVSLEKGLLKEWPKDGPKKDWTVSGCGGGYSSPAVAGGFIFGSGKINEKEVIWCRKESDGSPVWTTPFADAKKVGYDEGVKSTPTIHNGKVYVLGVGGDLVCMDAEKGGIVWQKSFTKEFKGRMMSGWGYSESVLIDGDKLICTPGADDAAVVALKPADGSVIWKAAVKNCGGAGYSSVVKATINKVDMYITLLGKSGGVVGIDAKTGKLLWQYTRIMNGTANIPTVVVKDDLIWCSTGYRDGGSALLKIESSSEGFKPNELKYYNADELQNHHGGMVLVGDYVFMGNRHNNGHPACVELKTGNIKWKENQGAAGGAGSGCVVAVDGLLIFRYQNGKVALVKANPEKFEVTGSFTIPEASGKPSWQHPVVANGKLYLRDQDKLHCYSVK
jgi:outer membrane protein assembly factor BamB